MDHTALSLLELGAVFFGLGVLGRLAGKIGMSPIPLYLLGGLAFGEGGVFPLGDISGFTSLASEIAHKDIAVAIAIARRHKHDPPARATLLRLSWLKRSKESACYQYSDQKIRSIHKL